MSRSAVAPAKVNLALHVVGRRTDGYHLLDTLVAFAHFGDRVTAETIDAPGQVAFAAEGPFADVIGPDADNLVVRAAKLVQAEAEKRGRGRPGLRIVLDKRLPVAAGIGGGSADAAATLRLLDDLLGLDLGLETLCRLGLALGADVPMCLHGATARVGGIGEDVQHLAPLPDFGLLLVNPGVALATPAVFKILESRHNPRLPLLPERFADCMHLARWLADTRNDLEPPAIRLVPVVAAVHAALAAEADCLFARMSGSGATSFGLFPSRQAAIEAGRRLAARHPDWWVAADF